MSEEKQNKIDSKFWDIASRWWCFPCIYLMFGFLISLLAAIVSMLSGGYLIDILSVFIYLLPSLTMLPRGFFLLFLYISDRNINESILGFILAISYLLPISLYSLIIYFRYQKGVIVKPLIISLLLFLLLSFGGCAIGVIKDLPNYH